MLFTGKSGVVEGTGGSKAKGVYIGVEDTGTPGSVADPEPNRDPYSGPPGSGSVF